MKKIIALMLVLIMMLSLCACGAKKEEAPAAEAPAADAPAEEAAAPAFVDSLLDSTKIVIATSPDYPPYEYYDEAGNIVGFDIDAINKVVEILNAQNGTNLAAEWQPMDFSTIISAVQVGQVDIGVSCFTYDPDRDVLFSDPYLKSAQCIVINSSNTEITSIADIVGKTVGAGPGTTGEAAAMDAGANCTSMGDYVQMFEILKNGGLDAIACDEAVALKYGELEEFTVLEERLVSEEVSVITENSKTALMDAFNAAIAEFMASEDYATLKAEHGLN